VGPLRRRAGPEFRKSARYFGPLKGVTGWGGKDFGPGGMYKMSRNVPPEKDPDRDPADRELSRRSTR